jgi:hypothetical protein
MKIKINKEQSEEEREIDMFRNNIPEYVAYKTLQIKVESIEIEGFIEKFINSISPKEMLSQKHYEAFCERAREQWDLESFLEVVKDYFGLMTIDENDDDDIERKFNSAQFVLSKIL